MTEREAHMLIGILGAGGQRRIGAMPVGDPTAYRIASAHGTPHAGRGD